jgi:Alpha/beta hydrolase domain
MNMLRESLILVAAGFLVAVAVGQPSEARVVRFVVEQQESYAGGAEWGTSGAYERLVGTAYIEVDPRDPLNAGIVNLGRAPRNDRGMVEFSAPFFMLKPVDMARGNQKMFYAINNRGNTSLLPAPTPAQVGGLTQLQLRLGYAVVDAGWQGDVVGSSTRLAPTLPVATQADGSPIVAALRIEYSNRTIPEAGTFTLTLKGTPAFRSYETADTDTAHSTLTVRDTVDGPKMPIRSDRWAFGTCPTGEASLVPTTTDICLFDGFRVDQLYELIYPATDPIVMGLGYAVTRDIGSFLRYETQDEEGNPNPLALSPEDVGIRRAYGSGGSSTGMYLRDWLYLGFNEDEAHRKVFDALTITVPGSHRLFANVEFADPDVFSDQDVNHDFVSTSYPPLTFAVTTDPISGIHDGILKRPATDPLVFQTDSSQEFWQFRASLNVHDGLGRPVRIPGNVRLYLNSGVSHTGVAGLLSPPGARRSSFFPNIECQNLTHAGGGPPTTARALLIALDAWADQGREPPRSNYPRVQSQTLVTLDEYRATFPAIPGVELPTALNELELLDFGPEFNSEGGRLTVLPPLLGPRYTVLVPKPDQDGLDIAGIRPIQIRAPLGTNTGWNLRAPGFRETDLCFLTGSYIPFATTEAERLASGDPRESLEERYGDHAGFVRAVRRAALQLLRQGFLLLEDANTFITAAEESDVLK